MLELHREGSAPAACAAGLFNNGLSIDSVNNAGKGNQYGMPLLCLYFLIFFALYDISWTLFTTFCKKKNPTYRRQSITRPMRIVAPLPKNADSKAKLIFF